MSLSPPRHVRTATAFESYVAGYAVVSWLTRVLAYWATWLPSLPLIRRKAMPCWTLPPELDDIVLDHLHDDRAALAQCALVRRSWLPTSRYHLWRDLRLHCSEADTVQLEAFLVASPAVAFYIRYVTVAQKKGEVCQWHDLQLLHRVLTTLQRLQRLEHLSLDGLWFGGSRRGEKTNALTFPGVRRLVVSTCSFDAFEDVQDLCHAFPALDRLQFDGVWWGRWTPESTTADEGDLQVTPYRVGLRELDLGSCFSRDKVIDWLLEALPAASVETLRLPLIGAYDMRLRDLLAFIGPALRHLEIGSPSSSTGSARQIDSGIRKPLESYLDLSQNTHLETLALGVPTYRDADFITTWLSTILTQIPSPSIREIRFAVYPILKGDAGAAETMLTAFGWPEIARLLRSRPQFSRLEKVTFVSGRSTDYLQIPGAFVPLQPLLQKIVPRLLGSLVEKGVTLDYNCV